MSSVPVKTGVSCKIITQINIYTTSVKELTINEQKVLQMDFTDLAIGSI